jgi:hypothetical protein
MRIAIIGAGSVGAGRKLAIARRVRQQPGQSMILPENKNVLKPGSA